MNGQPSKRTGVYLVEMVIAILIIGIVTAVAAPRIFNTATPAEANTTRHHLAVLRNAIEMYRARSGIYPPTNMLEAAIAPMLNGPFPAPSVGTARADANIYYDTNPDTISSATPNDAKPGGWVYKPANGNLRLNVGPSEVGFDW